MAVCYSPCWDAKVVTNVWWVEHDQVHDKRTKFEAKWKYAGVKNSTGRRVSAHWQLYDSRQETLPATCAAGDGLWLSVPIKRREH